MAFHRIAALGSLFGLVLSCGDAGVARPSSDAAEEDAAIGDGSGGADDAGCAPPAEQMHPSQGGMHVVSSPSGFVYNSNPPSSGPHCGVWGKYTTYTSAKPLPRCNYIHDLEHGAVVLLYNCPGGCDGDVEALEGVRAAAVDPDCSSVKRVIVTPDPDIDARFAAAAWQNTWTSGCLDAAALASLSAFVKAHLGSAGIATESTLCADGSVGP